MISVIPCRDEIEIKKLFNKHNIDANEYSGCVIASERDVVLGYCLYDLSPKEMMVYAIEPQKDLSLADGILRSALHVAAENFVLDTFYADCAPIDLICTLGFIKNADEKRLNIDKLFGGCNCSNKK